MKKEFGHGSTASHSEEIRKGKIERLNCKYTDADAGEKVFQEGYSSCLIYSTDQRI